MKYQDLLLDIDSDVARLTLNRPKQLNAMSARMLTELIRAADDIAASRVRAVVMTGRPFSADEALLSGFANQVVPSNQVMAATTELAESVASKSQFATRATKAHVAEILAGDRSRDDAATAAESMADPESARLRAEYLARMSRRP